MLSDQTTLRDRIDLEEFPASTTATLGLAALLWLALLEGGLPMPMAPLDAPMSAPGVPERGGTANGLSGVVSYLLLWGTMMLAMMLPSLAPAVRRVREASCGPIRRTVLPAAAFVGAYGVVWTLTGVVPLAVDAIIGVRELATGGGRLFTGGLLALAGAYQLAPPKRALLERCRCDVGVSHRPRILDGARRGFAHATKCVGCTWALFALMVGLGSMNVLVMVGLTLVVSLERLAPESDRYAVATGVVLLVGAVLTLAVGVPFGG